MVNKEKIILSYLPSMVWRPLKIELAETGHSKRMKTSDSVSDLLSLIMEE